MMKAINDNLLDDIPTKKMKAFHGSGCYKIKVIRVEVRFDRHRI